MLQPAHTFHLVAGRNIVPRAHTMRDASLALADITNGLERLHFSRQSAA